MNIYGASGHAKVIVEIIHSRKNRVSMVFDDNPAIKSILGYHVTHNPSKEMMDGTSLVIGVGDNMIRKRIACTLNANFHPCISHLSAVVSTSAILGDGTVVMANSSVNSEAAIGKHCIINTGAVVEHEVLLQNFVHISPNASIAGGVEIGEGTHVGIGAAIIPGIRVGKWVTVGAGAVIIKDIPDFAVVVGNPGKVIKFSEDIYE